MKKIVNITGWVGIIIGMIALLGFASNERSKIMCNGVNIHIEQSDGNFFVDETDIKNTIQDLGYELENELLADIRIHVIEKVLNDHPSIKNADVFATIGGQLQVNIEQRIPIMRVFSQNGDSYYVDKEGWLMPLSEKYTSRVLVVNGDIHAVYANNYRTNIAEWNPGMDTIAGAKMLNQLFELANAINSNEFWKAQINQVYVNEQGEFELIPKVGHHRILIGDTQRLQAKLDKLMVFYKEGLPKTGWNEYTVINLKYRNQVVCTKK